MSDSEWVTLEEAAAQLRKTPRQINEYCKEGKLEFHKMAGKTYISDESIGVFLELYEGKRRVPGGAEEDAAGQNKKDEPQKEVQDNKVAPQEVEQEKKPAEAKEETSATFAIEPETPPIADLSPEQSSEADPSDIKKFMPPSNSSEADPPEIKKPVPPSMTPETDTTERRYGEEPETAEPAGTSSGESRWKPKVTPADLSSEPEKTNSPAPTETPATPEQHRDPEPAPTGDAPSVSEPAPTLSGAPSVPPSSGIRPKSPDPSVTPAPVSDFPKATLNRPTEPVPTTQEVDRIVNDSTHSSELLKSIRDRITAHEAAEQAFCKEMRSLVDTLEAAFREEESKAGQLTKEISSLISRYSQQGE